MTQETTTLTSVGIDIGTTTTQVVVSELTVSSTGLGAVDVDTDKTELVYRGAIHETPLLDQWTLDIDTIEELVRAELVRAGYTPADIDSGAVIVTGESSYKTNAEELVTRIATDAGEFVVATAGPELEAVLAGTGSGAATWASNTQQTILNVDIGGATTNMCLFAGDSVVETRCLSVGGRLLRFDRDRDVVQISDPAALCIDEAGLDIEVGSRPSVGELQNLVKMLVDSVFETIDGSGYGAVTEALIIGDTTFVSRPIDGICFSGGVGQLLTTNEKRDPFEYNDLGGLLATALGNRVKSVPQTVRTPAETIRATVIGAGTRTTSFSGTTVSVEESLLPMKDLPVIEASLSGTTQAKMAAEIRDSLERGLALYEADRETGLALALPRLETLSYDSITTLADALIEAYHESGYAESQLPYIIVTQQNCAKALAQRLRATTDSLSPLIVIDEIAASDGDYLDIGTPIFSGRSVPVVVKSLAFGKEPVV